MGTVLTVIWMTLLLAGVTLAGAVVYVFTRYVPIISNLFLDLTVKTRGDVDPPMTGERVEFRTSDGVKLVGALTDGPPGTPVVVFCHEFSSTRDAAGRYGWFLPGMGLRVFTFDFRGQGESECPAGYVGRLWTTDVEMRDVEAALKYVKGRADLSGARVGLFGVSRGGAVALCAAGRAQGISAVVTDGAYSSSRTLMEYIHKWVAIFVRAGWMYRYSPEWLFRFAGWCAMKMSEVRMGARVISVERSLKRLRVPGLMVHGERDSYLDLGHARYLAGLNPEHVELWVVPKANHNEAVVLEREEYRQRLTQFFARHLKGETLSTVPETIHV